MARRKNDKAVSAVAAGAAGAVIGAGVAVAATAVLKNEKARKKIAEVLEDVRDRAAERIPRMGTLTAVTPAQVRQGLKMGNAAKKSSKRRKKATERMETKSSRGRKKN